MNLSHGGRSGLRTGREAPATPGRSPPRAVFAGARERLRLPRLTPTFGREEHIGGAVQPAMWCRA
jgi:hypothetical protein